MASTRTDYYAKITENICTAIEAGHLPPWRKTWSDQGLAPANLKSKKPYRGINVWILLSTAIVKGYTSPWWVTMKQANAMGGKICKGEKPTWIVFWKIQRRRVTETDENGVETSRLTSAPLMRVYKVWNLDQTEGLSAPVVAQNDHSPITLCEQVVDGFKNAPARALGRPAYSPQRDTVYMPELNAFETPEEYYAALFHEMVHSTGHSSRLDRSEVQGHTFGVYEYSKEELTAEFGAAYLCGMTGIETATIENQKAYLNNWLCVLKNDPRMLVNAAQRAQHAVDHILGETKTETEEE